MKIEPKELDQLKDIQKKSQNIIYELGEISYNEILLEQRKNAAKKILLELQDEEKIQKQFLIQKYGDGLNINLEDGSY